MSRDKNDENNQKLRLRAPAMSFARLFLTVSFALLLVACGQGSGANSLHVKSPATGEKDVVIKSSYAFAVTKNFTDAAGKITTAASYRVYAANYDLDPSSFAQTLDKPLTSDDQMRVVFSLVGGEGGTEKSPAMAGTYSAKADKFMKVEDVAIVSRRGGGDYKVFLDRSTLTGNAKVTSVSNDTMAADIDLTAGETIIKGSFTAKILKRR